MESGALADVLSDRIGDRSPVVREAFWNASSCQAPSSRGKGGDLSGRGDQPDIGAVLAASAGGGPAGDLMPSADHSCPGSGNEGMDLLIGADGGEAAASKGDD